MDYRTRHAKPLVWTADIFNAARSPEPYDKLSSSSLNEIIAPDGVTIFLRLHGYFDENNGVGVSYGIEAHRSCAMRLAFEVGDLSWPDFWAHKGWLLRFIFEISNASIQAEFIHPLQMDARMHQMLKDLGNTSPFEIKRKQLEVSIEIAYRFGRDPTPAEREYRDFMIRHGNKFIGKNKNKKAA